MMRSIVPVFAFAAALVACGSSDTEGSSTDAPVDDGRYHPEPNGVHTTEALACSAIADAHATMLLSLGCAGTARQCPDLLRAEFGTECLEYDQGSVDGCVAYLQEQKSCGALADAIGYCVVTAYDGTAPKGCP